ncbi:hypothetical protein SD80_011990 [Scytonema tolypothrichoides VB-61278]|nr:hypothetical protein SD80_011990 [Scytonema tolypothrichoides VB-61278]
MQDEAWRDEYRRALQIARWLDSMEGKLSVLARRTVMRGLSIITYTKTSYPWQSYQPQESSLFGLDARAFVAELHRPDGGAVGKIKRVGPAIIAELRQVLPPPGSPLIPSFPPPEPLPADAFLAAPDLAFTLLLEIWPRLRPSERARVTMTARELIAERYRSPYDGLDPLQDRAFAEEMLRRFVTENLTDNEEEQK